VPAPRRDERVSAAGAWAMRPASLAAHAEPSSHLHPLPAMSPAEVTEKLGLHRMRDRSWFVHPSCATSGEGLFEGESWRRATRAEAGVRQCCLALVPRPSPVADSPRRAELAQQQRQEADWPVAYHSFSCVPCRRCVCACARARGRGWHSSPLRQEPPPDGA
jgi:hypothetical protein